ncbi:JNK1/MAPK8-associated membrane protein-like isoform X2 [Physella acuta]|uniref:JNK1/MAPK8-associated membrane protein-like isoform X2 n=1 Tax=Physella acuta TaxID=109671 RepID=UPI0027DE8817|nr:JNK1/MAPK8-associated membrane protein-like isoform X2 [Physella acuta]
MRTQKLIILFIYAAFFVSVSICTAGKEVCPGRYCGRMPGEDTCGACPRGYAPDQSSECLRCNSSPTFYDWLYLGFMGLVSLVLHWAFIDILSRPKKRVLLLHLSATIETVLAGLLTLFLSDPKGTLDIRSCPVNHFSDWYTMLFNPTPDYYNTIYCTQEIVYPLYTMVMIYYVFSLVFMMLLRPIVAYKLTGCQGSRSIYAALYFLPILILVHSVLAGVIYYAFPYIIVVVSVITSACHLATEENQKMKELVKQNVTNIRNLTILLGHWLLHAYGIIAITQLLQPTFHAPLIALVPFPTIFYIFTVRFTDPSLVYPFKTCNLQNV